ncbi:HDOD domain-containing protein [Marinobacterium sp. D7]|nr:HDOD domain-containing protein [Marinobacterium ramblicola]MBV1787841.1 HDOD domain-containing protein [Marinobacterium ramblicola]
MHDAQGKVLVLLPVSAMLNLAVLWTLTGRKLQAVRGEDAERFFNQQGLQSEQGQQRLMQSFPLVIDASLEGRAELPLCELTSGLTFRWQYLVAEQQVQFGAIAVKPEFGRMRKQPGGGEDVVAITRAVERFTALRVQQRLEDTLGLPALAPTTQKIIMLRSDPDAGVDQLVPVVRLDPSLSAQVMSWAVSPYYAAPGKVNSIDEAIIRVLGFDLVVNLALGIAMGQVLKVPEEMPRGSTPYWQQSIYTATLCEKLARKIPLENRPKIGLAYLAGLLHNFGYLVLGHLFQPQQAVLSRYVEANPHLEPVLIEQQVLNVTRDQIGGWLLESWNLPEEVYSAIRQQQCEAPDGECASYAGLLQLSKQLLRREGLADGPIFGIDPELCERLGLSLEQADDAVRELLGYQDDLNELTRTLSRARA